MTPAEREPLYKVAVLTENSLKEADYYISASELRLFINAAKAPVSVESDADLHRRVNAGLRLENASLKGHVDILEKKIEAKDRTIATITRDNDAKVAEIKALRDERAEQWAQSFKRQQ